MISKAQFNFNHWNVHNYLKPLNDSSRHFCQEVLTSHVPSWSMPDHWLGQFIGINQAASDKVAPTTYKVHNAGTVNNLV